MSMNLQGQGAGEESSRRPHRPVVREVVCRTVLNKGSDGGYTLNCYTGCSHGCVYCYARFMQRFHPHAEPWGDFVDVKVNAVEALKRQLRRSPPGSVFVSSACDAWQPEEADRGLTRRCVELLLEHGFEINALTKSGLVMRDIDLFADPNASLGVTITTDDPKLARLWEPRCSSVEVRWRVLDEARRLGARTGVMFGPLLPYLSDDEESLARLFSRAADAGAEAIWVDALNPRPRVWPAVAALLGRSFPELRYRYSRLLFHGPTREAYLAEFRERVRRAAAGAGVAGILER